MKDHERRRLEQLIGETDVLALADMIATYYEHLKSSGFSVQKAFELTQELHDYICSSIFPSAWMAVQPEELE